MSGKSLISSLLEQGSNRVKLAVFKEARAEIWQIFRLVYVDGRPMPFAVCIRCMKPVAYSKKTTGSLHKHACASTVNKLWSKSLTRKRKNEEANGGIMGLQSSPAMSSLGGVGVAGNARDSGSGSASTSASGPSPGEFSNNGQFSSSMAALGSFGLSGSNDFMNSSEMNNGGGGGGAVHSNSMFQSTMNNLNNLGNGFSSMNGMSSLSNLQQLGALGDSTTTTKSQDAMGSMSEDGNTQLDLGSLLSSALPNAASALLNGDSTLNLLSGLNNMLSTNNHNHFNKDSSSLQVNSTLSHIGQNIATAASLQSQGIEPLVVAAAVAAATSAASATNPSKFGLIDLPDGHMVEKLDKLLRLFTGCLLPVDQSQLDLFNAELVGPHSTLIQVQILLQSTYTLALHDVRQSLKSIGLGCHYVLDFWSGFEPLDSFVTVWISYSQGSCAPSSASSSSSLSSSTRRQILFTYRLNTNCDANRLQSIVDKVLPNFVHNSKSPRVFVLENCPDLLRQQFAERETKQLPSDGDVWIECNAHQVQTVVSAFTSDPEGTLANTLRKAVAAAALKRSSAHAWIQQLKCTSWLHDWRQLQRLLKTLVDEWEQFQQLLRWYDEEQMKEKQNDSINCNIFDDNGGAPSFQDFQTLSNLMNQLVSSFDRFNQSTGVFGVCRFRSKLQQLLMDHLSGCSPYLQQVYDQMTSVLEQSDVDKPSTLFSHNLYTVARMLQPEGKNLNSFTTQQQSVARELLQIQCQAERDNRISKKTALGTLNKEVEGSKFEMLYAKMLKLVSMDLECGLENDKNKLKLEEDDEENEVEEGEEGEEEEEDAEQDAEQDGPSSQEDSSKGQSMFSQLTECLNGDEFVSQEGEENEAEEEEDDDEMVNGKANNAGVTGNGLTTDFISKRQRSDEVQEYLDCDLSEERERNHQFWIRSKLAKRFPVLQRVCKRLLDIECTPYCCTLTNRGASLCARRLALCNSQHLDQLLFLHTYFLYGQGCK